MKRYPSSLPAYCSLLTMQGTHGAMPHGRPYTEHILPLYFCIHVCCVFRHTFYTSSFAYIDRRGVRNRSSWNIVSFGTVVWSVQRGKDSDWPGRAVTVRPARHAHKKGTPGMPVTWMGVPVPIVRQLWAGLGRAHQVLKFYWAGRAVPPCLALQTLNGWDYHNLSVESWYSTD